MRIVWIESLQASQIDRKALMVTTTFKTCSPTLSISGDLGPEYLFMSLLIC